MSWKCFLFLKRAPGQSRSQPGSFGYRSPTWSCLCNLAAYEDMSGLISPTASVNRATGKMRQDLLFRGFVQCLSAQYRDCAGDSSLTPSLTVPVGQLCHFPELLLCCTWSTVGWTEGCVTATSAITCSLVDKLSSNASDLQPLIQLQGRSYLSCLNLSPATAAHPGGVSSRGITFHSSPPQHPMQIPPAVFP